MTSHDLRDVLNIPSDASAGPRPTKKQKTSAPRPNLKGLAREVQNLGGDNPIAIVPEVSIFKKRRVASRKPAARWELRAFTNSARADDGALLLRHWRRKTDDGCAPHGDSTLQDGEAQPGNGTSLDGEQKQQQSKAEVVEDSAYAKYNVQVQVPQYSEDQYHANLQNSDWTKEETDYLLGLVKEFDLRWTVIWDRYEFSPRVAGPNGDAATSTAVVPASSRPRTMEDLKARYYEVAAKMMAVQKAVQYMTGPEFQLYEMMQNFNPAQETARKEFALNRMARSKDEAREEESLLLEIKRILARTERFNEERRELYNRLDYPATDTDINSFKSSAGLQSLLQNLMNLDKSKKRKSIMAGPGDGVSPQTAVPGSAVSETGPGGGGGGHHRRESIAASASGNHRDSIAGTPATPVEPPPSATTGVGASKKKSSGGAQQVVERRKLTEQEEQIYGVTRHERLNPSGPTFRYEKINKLYSHKSGQQQQRITNALLELDIPPRLAMPTAAVTAQFEKLWSAVTALVDLRKVSDRLDSDIKVEEAKKAERDKVRAAKQSASGGGDGDLVPSVEKDNASERPPSRAGPAPGGEEKVAAGDGTAGGAAVAASVDSPTVIKEEQAGDKDKLGVASAAASRPGSSGAHKRSASVLSTTSDKSSKRQKK
ncbi:hypothetical protein B0H66DRAFT_302867 [Apodospora peruviana]|uniref:SWR1-complex protein 4 n=1 Tax=Apodospora peruviana TaxID=516989 RepID=A0AAE0I222_9PEZI|nr:hypothetical protein B0H66DRAFT_302867 [Apodospora peruviana]